MNRRAFALDLLRPGNLTDTYVMENRFNREMTIEDLDQIIEMTEVIRRKAEEAKSKKTT